MVLVLRVKKVTRAKLVRREKQVIRVKWAKKDKQVRKARLEKRETGVWVSLVVRMTVEQVSQHLHPTTVSGFLQQT